MRCSITSVVFVLLMAATSGCGPAGPPSDGLEEANGTGNRPPEILELTTAARYVHPAGETWLECVAADPDGDALTYAWEATGGSFSTPPGPEMTWIAPEQNGDWVVSVTVSDAAGHARSETMTLIVGDNQPPVIDSVQADAASLMVGESTVLTCVASDPEDDPLTYTWKADHGATTGTGPRVTWFAPEVLPGEPTRYDINLTVSDGHGGIDSRTIAMPVEVPHLIEIFSPLARETVSVATDGSASTRTIRAGDDSNNEGYRAFWSYDLGALEGTRIVSASLRFTTAFISASQLALAEDNPFNEPRGLGPLHVYQVEYAADGLARYDPERVIELTSEGLWRPPEELDATRAVRQAMEQYETDDRFLVMAAFEQDTNDNMFGEYISWGKVVLVVYYEE